MTHNSKLNSFLSSKTYLNFNHLLNSNKIIKISEETKLPKSINCNTVFLFIFFLNQTFLQVSSKSIKNYNVKLKNYIDSENLPLLSTEKSNILSFSNNESKMKPFPNILAGSLSPKSNIFRRQSKKESRFSQSKIDNILTNRRVTIDCPMPLSNSSSPFSRVRYIFYQ